MVFSVRRQSDADAQDVVMFLLFVGRAACRLTQLGKKKCILLLAFSDRVPEFGDIFTTEIVQER